MARSNATARLAFPLTLLLTLAVALLPVSWRLGWQNDLAEIVAFPLRPFSHMGSMLGQWLRPPRPIAESVPEGAEEIVGQLIAQRDAFNRLYQQERKRVLELEEQLRQLGQIPAEMRSVAEPRLAYVTRRNPASPLGVVELKVQGGGAIDIPAGTVAVYGSGHLLGRTVGESSAATCSLLPVTNRADQWIRGRVFPHDQQGVPHEELPLVQLEATGTGTFLADLDRSIPIARGDLVRVDDPGWPETAQWMLIGIIESIRVNDEEPLRHRIIVRPRYQVQDVAKMTLLIEHERIGETEDQP